MPLAYFPWTFEPLEINKQTVLIVLLVVAALGWLGASVAERRVVIRGQWVHAIAVLFALVPLFAVGTYDQPYMSFIGASGQEYTSMLTAVLLVVLMFLVPFVFDTARSQVRLWSGMLVAGAVVALAVVASFFE